MVTQGGFLLKRVAYNSISSRLTTLFLTQTEESSEDEMPANTIKSVVTQVINKEPTPPPPRKRKVEDNLMLKTGGAYIPPARLRMMQQQITDKSR